MEQVRQNLNESQAIDLFVAYRFLRILTTPWKDQEAYKLGIIDDNGNLVSLENMPEKFHILTSGVLYKHLNSRDSEVESRISEIIDGIMEGHIIFALDQQQYLQGYLPVVLMNLYITNKNTPAYKKLETGPSIINIENAQDVLALSKKGSR